MISLFNTSKFREEIKTLVVRLYLECDDYDNLDDDFIQYIEKKLLRKDGIKAKVLEYVNGLW